MFGYDFREHNVQKFRNVLKKHYFAIAYKREILIYN